VRERRREGRQGVYITFLMSIKVVNCSGVRVLLCCAVVVLLC